LADLVVRVDRVGEGVVDFGGRGLGELAVLKAVVQVVKVDVFYWFVAV